MDFSRRSFLALQGGALGATLLPGGLLAAVQAHTPPTPKLDDWDQVRAQFRLAPDYLHLAGFYFVSHPEPVRAAIDGFRRALDENPYLAVERGLFEAGAGDLQRAVREDVAAYLGGREDEVALTPNTTTGLALVYHGLPLRAGDEMLATTHDHMVHHEAIRLAAKRTGALMRRVPLYEDAATASTDAIVARVRAVIRPQTRVFGLTWVHSSTGVRLPVRQIAAALAEINASRPEDARIVLVVDGVHGLGAVDETVAEIGCDFFCAGTHKWMFAPRGTGLVWARTANWARIQPTIPSFSDAEQYAAWIEGREPRGPTVANRVTPGGFLAYEHQWAMGAAFRMHAQIGRARIAARIRNLNDRCKQGLAKIPGVTLQTPRDPALSAGICCFEVAGLSSDEVAAELLKRRVVASAAPYAVSYARLAPSLLNTPDQVDQAVAALRAVAKAAAA